MEQNKNKKVVISIKTPDHCEEIEGTFLVGVMAEQDSGEACSQGRTFLIGGGSQENAIAVVAMLNLMKAEVIKTYKINDPSLPDLTLEMRELVDKSINGATRKENKH